MSIRYLLELSERTSYPPELALAAGNYDRAYNIYVIETGPALTGNYWTAWGGTYDRPLANDVELFFRTFLQQVSNSTALISTDNSYFKEGDFVFFNIPLKPWQYFAALTSLLKQRSFSTAVKNPNNPSDVSYLDDQGNKILFPVRFLVPSLSNKLSSPISGSVLYTTFNVNLINNDGLFDDIQETNYVNTPIRILRSDIDNPDVSDFSIIRAGLVEHVKVNSKSFSITGADYQRTLEQSATDKFSVSDYPNMPDSTKDKNIPIGWGFLTNVPLIEVDINQFIAIDPSYLTSVQTVYDEDGNIISFSLSGGIITAPGAKTADITGKSNDRIGQIIVDIIANKGNIPYVEGPWDTSETDDYINTSFNIGMYYPSGTVRNLVSEALKSDSAYIISKNDGRLTLRKWGNGYGNWLIDSWRIMKIPTKSNQQATKFYNSSVVVKFSKQELNNNYLFDYLDDTREQELVNLYKKSKIQNYETRLLTEQNATALAKLMLIKFGDQSETLTLALGESIIEVNLLDKITLEIDINDRVFSRFSNWIITEINPAQDTFTIESLGGETKNVYLGTSEDDVILATSNEAWIVEGQE